MSDKDRPAPDPMETWISLTRQFGRAQTAFADFLECKAKGDGFQIPDPNVVGDTFATAWLDLLRAIRSDWPRRQPLSSPARANFG